MPESVKSHNFTSDVMEADEHHTWITIFVERWGFGGVRFKFYELTGVLLSFF
ncbi:hypothetical protein T4A_9526 [Trichinella pseudospiralis]|uniref:Uncharacterized protein n=1 Tax=Trichinella pseudospiralis TaxID=6337 RepID=A0A0V1DU69_TRIPS|nr:hypothetical protein T4A_9526 [Trichinella pseudospiralis]KRZ24992.1 hypothetical protein T4C_907 [Trichinella pseudospiralis]